MKKFFILLGVSLLLTASLSFIINEDLKFLATGIAGFSLAILLAEAIKSRKDSKM